MPTYPITEPPDNAPAYTWTQPVRDGIAAANDHQTRVVNLEYLPVSTKTGTTYTFVLADAGAVILANNAGAQAYSIPLNSSIAYPVGTLLTVVRYGAGTLTLDGVGGVTVNTPATKTARAQYSMISALKLATNEWLLSGDLT